MPYLYLVGEDELHLGLLNRILDEVRPDFQHRTPIQTGGFGDIKKNIQSYNKAASAIPFLILTDLDCWECPLALIEDWINFDKHPNLLFRIAVREAEAWLLADRENLAKFLSLSVSKVPRDPENHADPKQLLVNLARESKRREIREDITPIGTAHIGPAYNVQMTRFVSDFWDVEVAQQNSESLSRLIHRLRHFQPQLTDL